MDPTPLPRATSDGLADIEAGPPAPQPPTPAGPCLDGCGEAACCARPPDHLLDAVRTLGGGARPLGGLVLSEPALAPTEARRAPRSRGTARQAWIERLQRFAGAGLSPAQFCAAEGVSLPSFYAWKRRLAAEAAGPTSTTPDEPGPGPLPVRCHDPRAAIELVLSSGAILRVAAGADEATLRCLLRLLGVQPC